MANNFLRKYAHNDTLIPETTIAQLHINDHFLSKISLKFSNCRFIRILSTLHDILSLNLVPRRRKQHVFKVQASTIACTHNARDLLTLHVVRRLVTFGIQTSKQTPVFSTQLCLYNPRKPAGNKKERLQCLFSSKMAPVRRSRSSNIETFSRGF